MGKGMGYLRGNTGSEGRTIVSMKVVAVLIFFRKPFAMRVVRVSTSSQQFLPGICSIGIKFHFLNIDESICVVKSPW